MFAAAAGDVVRIGTVRDSPAEELVLDTALGNPLHPGARHRRGPRRAASGRWWWTRCSASGPSPLADVQPLPAFAAACIHSGALAGLVLLDDVPMPLIDLPTLLRERVARAAAPTLPTDREARRCPNLRSRRGEPAAAAQAGAARPKGEAGRLVTFLHGIAEGKMEDRLDVTSFDDAALRAVAEQANAAAGRAGAEMKEARQRVQLVTTGVDEAIEADDPPGHPGRPVRLACGWASATPR